MIGPSDPGIPVPKPIFADPTPLGYIGLAVSCAAQMPIAFGAASTPIGLRTAATICLLFGVACQFLAGIMNFTNKNLLSGLVLTVLSFIGVMDAWVLDMLAAGQHPDTTIMLTTESAVLVVLLVLTYGVGYISKLLVGLLVNLDLIFVLRIINSATGSQALNLPIAILTITLGLLALWIAFGTLINPTSGQHVIPFPGPLFSVRTRPTFDLPLRDSICEVLYRHFKDQAFQEMPIGELQQQIRDLAGEVDITPDLFYLNERGALAMTFHDAERSRIAGVRLSAAGIDMHEQSVLKKFSNA
jgi:succinate-acetate transporter protein